MACWHLAHARGFSQAAKSSALAARRVPPLSPRRFGHTIRPAMRRYFPDLAGFTAAASSAQIVPVYRQILGDRLTPVSAFEVLGRDPNAFLLESVIGGERIARY